MQQADFSTCERVLSSRWMLSILWSLQEPQAQLPGLSRGVLAAQLQELVRMSLVSQTKYMGFPPRVDYTLTEAGQELLELLSQLPEMLAAE